MRGLRVGTSVGHGEKAFLGVVEFEVLVGELLTIDRFATSALYIIVSSDVENICRVKPYIITSEVTTLKHKLRNDAVED